MKSTLTIDLSDPGVAEVFKDCEVGESKDLLVTASLTAKDDATLSFTVESVEYANDDEYEEPEPATDNAASENGKKKMAPAIAIVMAEKQS